MDSCVRCGREIEGAPPLQVSRWKLCPGCVALGLFFQRIRGEWFVVSREGGQDPCKILENRRRA